MSEQLKMTELEEKLQQDQDGTYRDMLVDTLSEETRKAKAILDRGLPPDEFREMEAVHNALIKAVETVKKIWDRTHGKNTATL